MKQFMTIDRGGHYFDPNDVAYFETKILGCFFEIKVILKTGQEFTITPLDREEFDRCIHHIELYGRPLF